MLLSRIMPVESERFIHYRHYRTDFHAVARLLSTEQFVWFLLCAPGFLSRPGTSPSLNSTLQGKA